MKRHLLLIWFCLSGIISWAQMISGRVVDVNGNPLEFVNIILLQSKDSVFVAGTISDNDGRFIFNKSGDLIKFSSIGYKSIVCFANGKLDPVVMYEETNSLDEVVIKANLPKYKLTNDGIRTKVSGTTLSKAGTASDVLRSLPLVKEEDEGFSIFGKGTPSIYVNGRLIRDLTELEKIKSDDIKNVEVITEPGARYDASVSCVIKIKTVSFNGEGWGFSMYSDYFQADKEDAAVQLDVNYIRNKLDMFATVRFNHDNYWTKSVVNQAVFVDTLWNQNNFMLAEGRRQNAQTSLGMNYHINDSNIIGTRLQIGWHIDNDETTRVESMVFANDAFYDRWKNRENKTFSNPPQFDYNFFYEGKAGKFTFDYNFDILIGGSNLFSDIDEHSETNEDRIVQSENEVSNKLFASRLVTGCPLFGGELYIGAEHSFVNRMDNYLNYQEVVPSSYSRLKENYLSAFMEYNKKFRYGILKAGLRYEYVNFKYFDNGIYKPEQSRKYNQLFPNVSFTTKLGMVGLQLSYVSKVQRPSFSQLSNNVFYGNRYTLQSGNPLLKPSVIRNLGISALWKFVQMGVAYSIENDAIIYSAEQMEDNQAVTKVMFKNLDKLKVATSFLSITPEIGFWTPQITVGVRKQWLTIESNNEKIKMNKPLWNTSFNNSFKLPWNIVLSLNFSFQSKGDYQNVYFNTTQYILNASVTKSFFNKKLTMQLKGYDLLDGYKDGNLLYNKQMQMNILNRVDRKKVGISVKYRFNLSPKKYKGNNSLNQKSRL